MSFEGISHWTRDHEDVVAKIAGNFRPLKILLKTKDDPEELQKWLDHHRRIVGDEGLIILDNMSSDPEVAQIYSIVTEAITLARFAGYHNIVHHTEYFADLYKALRVSCSHFVFLDTDERLAFFDGDDHFRGDSSLQTFLSRHSSTGIFPGTWLQNVTGHDDRFYLQDPMSQLAQGLQWGKPIISSSSNFSGMINHNCQIDRSVYDEPILTNVFVLHLSRVTNRQRINANLRKLRNCKAISVEDGINEVLQRSQDSWLDSSDQVKHYVKETRMCFEQGMDFIGDPRGSIQIAEDGLIIGSEPWQLAALRDFVLDPQKYTTPLYST